MVERHTRLNGSSNGVVEDITEHPSTPVPELRWGDLFEGNSCLYKRVDGQITPVISIHYKPPFKLSVDAIITGLESEIQPDRDIINRMGRDFLFASQSLVTAVITQLFSFMVEKGTQYGYVCTGEAFIFLQILDDPNTVYYSVCIPSQDVNTDDDTGLHRTTVAQVFAFILRALRAKPPPTTWYEDMAWLDTWAMEYDDILKKIPPMIRKRTYHTPYNPSSWKGLVLSSPIQTRSHSVLPEFDYRTRGGNGRGGNSSFNFLTPPLNPADLEMFQQASEREERIENRLLCSQKCLWGLMRGGPLDKQCPNVHCHAREHIGRLQFLRLIRIQLATDRGRNADCMPICISSAISTLFKVRLSSHGYTVVAKGVETSQVHHLRRENELYDRLEEIQGKYVPVCLGIADLDLPWYHFGGKFNHLMFLGLGGQPIRKCITYGNKTSLTNAVVDAFRAMHKFRVLHFDPDPRTILYNTEQKRVMIADLERAIFDEFQGQQVLDLSGTDSRTYQVIEKIEEDNFARELQHVREIVMRLI
jgi:hypothetical protein